MKDGLTAFAEFKRLLGSLREWGFDVCDDGEFGEFALGGFICSFRYDALVDVMDVNFLRPGEFLEDRAPDFILSWNGREWVEPSGMIVQPQHLSTAELHRMCVRTINLMAGGAIGIGASFCVVPTQRTAA